MTTPFPIHDHDSASEAARDALEGARATFGFIPNVLGIMAESPALAEAYMTLAGLFEEKSDLSATEQQVVLLTCSRYHECTYCMAAHTAASGMQNVPDEVVSALREDRPLPDERLEALRQVVRQLVDQRGHLSESQLRAFLDAGYSQRQLLDVLVGLAQKTLSNFTNHLAETPLDKPLQGAAWTAP